MEKCDMCGSTDMSRTGIGIYVTGVIMKAIKELWGDIIAENDCYYKPCKSCEIKLLNKYEELCANTERLNETIYR